MKLTSIVSIQHTSQFGFVDEENLCYAVPFGLVIEHVATGRQVRYLCPPVIPGWVHVHRLPFFIRVLQRHLWLDHKLHEAQGHATFAIDQASGQIALHQDGCRGVVNIICSRTSDVVDSLVIHGEQHRGQGSIKHEVLCHMSFSSDGTLLVLGVQSHVSTVWIFSRPSSRVGFVHACSHKVTTMSTSSVPTFGPSGTESLCWLGPLPVPLCCMELAGSESIAASERRSDAFADEGAINVIRMEPVLGRIDVKSCQVDVTALSGSDRFTAHTWHPDGSLIVGTRCGKLFIVPQAAVPLARSHEMDAANCNMFRLQPVLEAELSRWTAGAIVSLHVVGEDISIIFECPDGKGGLLLWAALSSFTAESYVSGCTAHPASHPSLRAVQLPPGTTISSAKSLNHLQIAVMHDVSKILLLRMKSEADVGSFELASTSHSGHVIGVETIQGTPAAAGILFVTLDVMGQLRAFVMEPRARLEAGDVATKLTLLQSGSIGARGAAIASHPILPLMALATVTGGLYLIGIPEFTGCMAQSEVHESMGSGCVQFCARVMEHEGRKELKWSPDGAILACLDMEREEIILLKRKASPLQKDKHVLVPLNRITLPQADRICWHQPGTCTPILVVHQAKGHILLLDLPREAVGANAAALTLQSVLRSSYRLTEPLADMHVLHPNSSEGHVSIIGATMDCSIRKYRLSLERSRNTAKKASSHVVPLASIEAEALQV